jgi:hypothetical protein
MYSDFESLVTIATMLDNTFGILNNACPCFQWAEIDLCFPSDNRYFEIESYDTIPEYITEGLHPPLKMKIKDAFLCLFSPPETADEGLKPLRSGNLTPMDMQILILCRSLPSASYFFPTLTDLQSPICPYMGLNVQFANRPTSYHFHHCSCRAL